MGMRRASRARALRARRRRGEAGARGLSPGQAQARRRYARSQARGWCPVSTETEIRIQDLRTHADAELRSMVSSLTSELFKYRMQRYTNQLENTMYIRKVRRNL